MSDFPKVPFETDAATLAVFDPKALLHRMRQPSSWWRDTNALDLDEVLAGKVALFPIGDEGNYACRLELDAATAIRDGEKPLVRGAVGGLGVSVTSGDLFVGAAERLPGDGVGDRVVQIPNTGRFHEVPAGDYDVTVHVLDWRTNRSFFDEEGEPLATAPPDFVVVLAKRERPFDAPLELLQLLELVPRAEAKASALRVPPPVRRAAPARVSSSSASGSRAPVVEEDEAPAPPSWAPLEMDLIRRAFKDVIRARDAGMVAPSARFAGGALVFKPRDASLQTKDVPVEELYGKLVRVRDQMRVLEQKINSHEGLEEHEQLNLDTRVTAVYDAVVRLVAFLADTPSVAAVPAPAVPAPAVPAPAAPPAAPPPPPSPAPPPSRLDPNDLPGAPAGDDW